MKTYSRTLLIALVLVMPWCVRGAEPQTLADFKEIYIAESLKIQTNNVEKDATTLAYIKYLDGLETSFKKAGDYSGTKAILKEKGRFELEHNVPDTTPPSTLEGIIEAQTEYRSALHDMAEEKNVKLDKLTLRYVKALRKHIANLLQQNKMQEAEAANEEIERASALMAQFAAVLTSKVAPSRPRPDAPTPNAKGPVLHYSFDANSTIKIIDQSGRGNDGAAFDATWSLNGKKGGCLEFNGAGSYIAVNSDESWDITPMGWSVCLWVRPLNLHEPVNLFHCAGRNNICNGGENYLYYQTREDPVGLSWGAINGEWDSGIQLALDKWQHVAAVYEPNSQTASIYIDGVKRASVAVKSIGHAPGKLKIGEGANIKFFKGKMDEFMIFQRALSDKEIKKLYDSQK